MLVRQAALALLLCASGSAWAGFPTFCERSRDLNAAEQDRVLRFAGVVKQELARSNGKVALIARAGTDLSRFNLVYSHAGVALRERLDGRRHADLQRQRVQVLYRVVVHVHERHELPGEHREV